MSQRTEVSLGDLLRAMDRLQISEPAAIRELASVLGLSFGAPPTKATEPAAPLPAQVPVLDIPSMPPEPEPAVAEPISVGPTRLPAAGDALEVVPESLVADVRPSWAGSVGLLETPPEEDPLRSVEPPPLLTPATTRALLAALVAGAAEGGPIDVEKAIEVLARGWPLQVIPRRRLPTLRYGVQVLVDRGPALLPYRADQQRVVHDLRFLVGPDRVQVLRFSGDPFRAGPGTPRTWGPYAPPPAGTSVLVLSDLGLCRSSPEGAPLAVWIDFAEWVGRSGCRLVALVPYDARSWPPALRARLRLIYWDRATTVAQVRTRHPSRIAL
ncbi:MAG TPA: hypothetical protein VF756_13070 [Thermoanaerobaculia bacterium]